MKSNWPNHYVGIITKKPRLVTGTTVRMTRIVLRRKGFIVSVKEKLLNEVA